MSKRKAKTTVAENPATVINENAAEQVAENVQQQEAQQTEAEKHSESTAAAAKEAAEQPQKTIVVGVYPGTEDLVKKVFAKLPEEIEVIYVESKDATLEHLVNLVAAAVSDPEATEEFILVPCGTIPCDPLDLAALELSTVYVNRLGKKEYDSRLPLVVNTEKAVAILEELEAQNVAPELLSEEFAERYIKAHRPRPVEVSHYFGNYVTTVRRGDPCENVVIASILQKKFITATEVGFKAIAPLVEEAFK